VVVDFFATWCGPCKTLAPILEGLERKHTSTIFAKIDVDQAQDCAKQYGVSAMPTILFFKNRSEVSRVVGADVGKIQALIKTYEGGSSFSGTGQTLGGSSSSSSNNFADKSASPSIAGRRNRALDSEPYHMRLWTALGHLSTGVLNFCARCVQSVFFAATSAKAGLVRSGSASAEVKTIEGPGGSCQIQVRMLDGSSIRGDFEPEHTVQRVHDFVRANMEARGIKAPGFSLMTNFPKT
ncbi:thioredoxin-like protein, partial [Gamsiella multidivaricata]|uniref:thioredoxin-like protein n=1 Tax=Gamsiella multidivaricata TaxID=101098 RepID=UPI00222034FA